MLSFDFATISIYLGNISSKIQNAQFYSHFNSTNWGINWIINLLIESCQYNFQLMKKWTE